MVAARKLAVLVVDDHPLFRAGLAVVLRATPELEVVGEVGDAASALEVARRVELDLAIIDVLLPNVSGISLVAELRELQPRCVMLGLSSVDEPTVIADLLRAGAAGFAVKTQPIEEIIGAIWTVLGGVRSLPSCVSHDAIDRELAAGTAPPLDRLTRREREVFELVIRGYSNDEVAGKLFIARRTVETHRHRVMKKLSARSIVEMMRVTARHGGLSR